jgi:HEPN domain-containing protein
VSRPDPRAEAERWLAQAENDLAFAEHGLRLGFYAQTCFLAQQVAEKALKALHYARGARIVIGHSVDGLLEALEPEAAELGELRRMAKELDQHYVPARYPNALPGTAPFQVYTEEQASRAIETARRIVAFVARRVRAPSA